MVMNSATENHKILKKKRKSERLKSGFEFWVWKAKRMKERKIDYGFDKN